MYKLDNLKKSIRKGQVYRREDLAKSSKSIDRDLAILVQEGSLKKLAQGLYYAPKKTVFGDSVPEEKDVIKKYLKGDDFLITSPNYYNSIGLGTTQLYNSKSIYNHKKHEDVKLGNKVYQFRRKSKFPKQLSSEYLVIDLLNNLKSLEEDEQTLLHNLKSRVQQFNKELLKKNAARYGSIKAKKIINELV
ncbi:hypothetical protein L950_0222670 [Sphingobacterium sp. IITKGP-BTPF85]|nr:hypothetical protein L950_0222670 [Sphingobacterium sp. IITKGP-BTPF85]